MTFPFTKIYKTLVSITLTLGSSFVVLGSVSPVVASPSVASPSESGISQTRMEWSGKLKGIVCALCIQSIKKRVNTLPEVESSEIELRSGVLTVYARPGQFLSKERIEEEVVRAGYELAHTP